MFGSWNLFFFFFFLFEVFSAALYLIICFYIVMYLALYIEENFILWFFLYVCIFCMEKFLGYIVQVDNCRRLLSQNLGRIELSR